jgi:hypothetical protein
MSSPRVLFLAPTVAHGSGGVADYCRNLGVALSAEGFECHLASWNESQDELDHSAEDSLPVVGLQSATRTMKQKADRLREYLDEHEIDWVSLQFVNFGFGKRGLVAGLADVLAATIGERRCHIFLHELWLGAHRGAKLRDKVLGRLQKKQILHFLAQLKPRAIWTSVPYYQRLLAREGIASEVAPIFSSVPMTSQRVDEWLLQQCAKTPAACAQSRPIFVGLFGSIYPDWPFREVLPRVLRWAGERHVVFVLFGRNGDATAFSDYVKAQPRAELLLLGELAAEQIDRVMNTMDLALATTPAEGIGKSTSAIGFLERGVPTIAVHGKLESDTADGAQHPCLLLLNQELEKNLNAVMARPRVSRPMLPVIAACYRELFLGTNKPHAHPLSCPA